jgi:hypothetical protein
MHKPLASWRIVLAVVGLALLLTACGSGDAPTGPTGTPTPTPIPFPAQSTVSFTASGGLSGSYTINDPGTGSTYSNQALNVVVGDQDWFFTLSYHPYPGPGTYSFSNISTNASWGSVAFSSKDGTKAWLLLSSATCQLAVTSDIDLKTPASGPQYHEVKGTFSCPTLTPPPPSGDPLAISDGQFDVVAQVAAVPTETPTPTPTPSPTPSA